MKPQNLMLFVFLWGTLSIVFNGDGFKGLIGGVLVFYTLMTIR